MMDKTDTINYIPDSWWQLILVFFLIILSIVVYIISIPFWFGYKLARWIRFNII